MYRFSFNNLNSFSRSNPRNKPIVVSQSNRIENIMKCSYCENSGHMIVDCPFDKSLDKILSSDEEPDFNTMTLKTLKRIASLVGIKVSLGKLQYTLMFKKIWLTNRKKILEEREEMEKKIQSLNRIGDTENNECPVCMEEIGKVNSCVSKCGHKYCLECLLKSFKKKNCCPLCREKLCEEEYNDEYADLPDLIEDTDFIPFDNNEGLSEENILNYIHYIENRNNSSFSPSNSLLTNLFYSNTTLDQVRN